MEFVQCAERQGTNVQCDPVRKEWARDSANYCSRHLVKPDAPVKCIAANGPIVEE
ncbi:hypothetical protein BT67DRAFT_387747 [Trichocladium antarcticum]|uniref:Uncharacterized protein n=1 Tax=Trichocladium antarcticum TaxID=1450529 RepID=A0AAN6UH26_9PEZI|nr:hypothetical protein BT67DRAFT_387747 [Trichocladium antarcticum]